MTATLAQPANRLFTHLARIDPKLVKTSEGRKEMCALDPMLFALIYLPHHLKNDFGKITISYVHEDWADEACEWIATSAAVRYRDGDENDGDVVTQRDSYVAPRSMGKSTWFFLILPLW